MEVDLLGVDLLGVDLLEVDLLGVDLLGVDLVGVDFVRVDLMGLTLYSLGSPRSCGRMPSLVGDSGQVLGVLGWALTRIRNLPLVMHCCRQDISTVAACGTEL